MRQLRWFLLSIALIALFATVSVAQDRTETGFYYPTGTSSLGSYAGWLAVPPAYLTGLYHLGKDIRANFGDPVYAIAGGVITRRSPNGWGTGNVAAVIKHRRTDGTYFWAVYGHIRGSFYEGQTVVAGQQFATIGLTSPNHLHFGINPATGTPSNLGNAPLPPTSPYYGFVDPINWIRTQIPYGLCTVASFNTAVARINSCRGLSENAYLGNATSSVHEWHPTGGNGYWVYIRDYQYGSIVFDAMGGAVKAYAVSSYFLGIWANDHGCAGSNLGRPIGNRYWRNGGWRQDYAFGYLLEINGINPGPRMWGNDHYGPGVLQEYVWSCAYSIKFTECWYRAGGIATMGIPSSGDGSLKYVHAVQGSTAVAQDFIGGSYSNSFIFYDINAPSYASIVASWCPAPNTANQACEMHGAIRAKWESYGAQRFTTIGYPFTNEVAVSGKAYTRMQRTVALANGRCIGKELRWYGGSDVRVVQIFDVPFATKAATNTDITESETPLPNGLTLSVAPNPTRCGCAFQFSLPQASQVTFDVYDAGGRCVRSFNRATHPAGAATLQWDGNDGRGNHVASGVYFVRLSTPDNIKTQRIVILR